MPFANCKKAFLYSSNRIKVIYAAAGKSRVSHPFLPAVAIA